MFGEVPSSSTPAKVAGPTYHDHAHWLRYQNFLPGALRVTTDNAPVERWWRWGETSVHLDCLPRPEAPATLLCLHGLGAYGRMLGPFGRMPTFSGLEFLAPDLPGFGLTETTASSYAAWVECVLDLIDWRRRTDPRPIVLFGVGMGGRLAYDVAARTTDGVAGVIVTSLLDARRPEVRRYIGPSPGPASSMLPMAVGPVRGLRVPLHWFANIAAMANHTQFAQLVWSDPLGGAARVPLGFIRSYAVTAPAVDPEVFRGPPILLAQPGEDRWTPSLLARRFLDRIAAPTRCALLRNAGHLPIEETALADLDRAAADFLGELPLP